MLYSDLKKGERADSSIHPISHDAVLHAIRDRKVYLKKTQHFNHERDKKIRQSN